PDSRKETQTAITHGSRPLLIVVHDVQSVRHGVRPMWRDRDRKAIVGRRSARGGGGVPRRRSGRALPPRPAPHPGVECDGEESSAECLASEVIPRPLQFATPVTGRDHPPAKTATYWPRRSSGVADA